MKRKESASEEGEIKEVEKGKEKRREKRDRNSKRDRRSRDRVRYSNSNMHTDLYNREDKE